MKKLFFFTALLLTFSATRAQLAETLKTQMVHDWERAKAYTKEYLEAMPKDKYDFKAEENIRSFAQQMIHLAQANIGLSANGTGAERAAWAARPLEKTASALSPDSVMYFVLASYDYAINGIKNMDASKLEEKNKRGQFEETKLAWLLKAFEHQTHHRGQTTIYLRRAGIKPPEEKLF